MEVYNADEGEDGFANGRCVVDAQQNNGAVHQQSSDDGDIIQFGTGQFDVPAKINGRHAKNHKQKGT